MAREDSINSFQAISDQISFRPEKAEGNLNSFFNTFHRDDELLEKLISIMHDLRIEDLDKYQHGFSFTILNEEENAALNHVLISLKAYYSCSNPVLPFNLLKYKVIEFEGASFLKKLRKKAIVNRFKGTFYEEPEWINDIPLFHINEIGDIFNYQYCFPWEALDELDYLYSQKPLLVDPEYVDKFKTSLSDLLDQVTDVIEIKPYEVLLNLSGSKCLLRNGKKSFHYQEKYKNLEFSKKRRPGKRIFVTTAPADGRDAIINEVNDLNRIQWIEYQLDYILQNNDVFRHYLVDKDEETFLKKYEKFFDDTHYFLMRDIKKEGLTKPKYLLSIMLSILYKKFPQCKAFSEFSFYDGPWYEGDTGVRGHGLGMANNLTTLMQIVMFRMVQNELFEQGLDIALKMICHNDDIIIGVDGSHDDLDDAINTDIDILENLGIIISRDKSFSSSFGGIICERYIDRENSIHKKKSYLERDKLLMFTCVNVTHLKSCLSSFYYKYRDDIDIRPLIAKYGYEFTPNELNLPISLGGWERLKSYRVSFDLIELEKRYSHETYRMWRASRLNKVTIKKKKNKKFVPPLLQLFPELRSVPEEIHENFFILNDSTIFSLFNRIKFTPSLRAKGWDKLMKARRKIFFNTNQPVLPFDSVVKIILEDGKNYYPVSSMIDRWVDIEIHEGYMVDPYIHPNPVGCALKKLSLIHDEDLRPAFYPLKCRSYEDLSRADTRKSIGLVINYVPSVFIFKEEETIIPKDDSEMEPFFRSYPAPLLIGKVCQISGKIPILKSDFWIKKDTWDFYLNKDEFLLYNRIPHYLRETAISLKRKYSFTNFEILSLIEEVSRKRKPPITPEYDSEEEEAEKYLGELQMLLDLSKVKEVEPKDTWQESWELLLTVSNRGNAVSYDDVIFELDKDMYPIVQEMKSLLNLRQLNINLTGEFKDELATKVNNFKTNYEGFYNEFLKEYFEEEDSDIDFGGDFEINDFDNETDQDPIDPDLFE